MSKFGSVLYLVILLIVMVAVDCFIPAVCKINTVYSNALISRISRPGYATRMTLSQKSVDDTTPLEHRGVPTEHQGLHSALYSDGDDHGASDQSTGGDLVLTDVTMSVAKFLDLSKGKKAAGVFSISGNDQVAKFIGFSRNLHASISALKQSPTTASECATVRIQTFKFPKRDELQQLQNTWLGKLEYVPVGNQNADSVWEAALKDQSRVIDDNERKLQEEKKFKLRKAMADSTLIDELPQLSEEEKYRRKNLEMAVTGDDWSGEIDRQTAATVSAAPAAPAPPAPAAAPAVVVSPFQGGGAGGDAGGAGGEEPLAFTVENVDRVLDEVRPYMMADGGNCKVTGVDAVTGDVRLVLEGACGSCPSSTVTLKMGVERVLREKFGSRLGQVISEVPSAAEGLSVALVEGLLDPVRPAVVGLGGSIKVREVDLSEGRVTIEYKGPQKLTYGLELTLKENPLIRQVVFV